MRKRLKRKKKRHVVGRGVGAALVRAVRRRYKLTQTGLAQRLGVAQMTVSRWEAGAAPLRPSMRLALVQVGTTLQANAKLAAAARGRAAKKKGGAKA